MKVERGASQVLFGMLPTQTVDLQGRVWKVAHWTDPVKLPLDAASVRNTLLEVIAPWSATGEDDGLANELRMQAPIEVVGVNKERGVAVDAFPKQWNCRQCGRISNDRGRLLPCKCGASSAAQMQFVAYHSCGNMREPTAPRCPTHGAAAVRFPGTATARELSFSCPDCRRHLRQGFPFQPCTCGAKEGMSVNVHRAGAVFTPHYAVLVNPPDPASAARLRARGGGTRALEWILDGLQAREPGEGKQTVEGLIDTLVQQGLSPDLARRLADEALAQGQVARGATQGDLHLPPLVRERAQEEALSLTSALDGGRVRVRDMVEGTTPPLRTLYEGGYTHALWQAKLSNVELLTSFPVATIAYGYTRGGLEPGQSRLVTFRDRGMLRAYGTLSKTEGLLFQLDPCVVHEYLSGRGYAIQTAANERDARLAILRAIDVPHPMEQHPQPLGGAVVTLLHSYAHRLIRTLAALAGIERDGLAEYLLPHHLSIVVYAVGRGEFVLGGLQAIFETALHRVLSNFVNDEARCPLDPGCRNGGGACMACLHLGEPSCRWFNRYLDRAVLFSGHAAQPGFLR